MLEQERNLNIEKITPPSEKKEVPVSNMSIPFVARSLSWSTRTNFNGGPTQRRKFYQVTLLSWFAAFVDGLVLLAMSCIFLLVFAKIVQSPTLTLMKEIRSENTYLVIFAQIYFASSWFYMIFMRSFFARTLGEWSCDLRLGYPSQAHRAGYVFKVFIRSTVTTITGLFVLPVLSLVFNQDLAGRISGLKILSLSRTQ